MDIYGILIMIITIILFYILFEMNIKKMLNDKLSHIEIKIPEQPHPNIIVKIQRKCDSDIYDVIPHSG